MIQSAVVPRVSVGMPVFNGERYIRHALDGLLAQTWTDFELIVSDNGSTDGTQAICEEYAARDPRIRYVRQPRPIPVSDNFAFVFREARGEYFQWAACDDQLRPSFLENAVSVLDLEPQVALVFSNWELYNFPRDESRHSECVIPSCGTSRLRVMIRLLSPLSNLLYGVFRRQSLSVADIAFFDFWDVWFGTIMAIRGDIHILPERLFIAGEKEDARLPYSITGKRISYRPYLKATRALLKREFRGIDRMLLTVILYRQVFAWFRAYRLKGF